MCMCAWNLVTLPFEGSGQVIARGEARGGVPANALSWRENMRVSTVALASLGLPLRCRRRVANDADESDIVATTAANRAAEGALVCAVAARAGAHQTVHPAIDGISATRNSTNHMLCGCARRESPGITASQCMPEDRAQRTTLITAAPFTVGSLAAEAVMVATPGPRAVTSPLSESTLAVTISLVDHRNRVSDGTPGHGVTAAVSRSVSPTPRMACDGETVGPRTMHAASFAGEAGLLPDPHAVARRFAAAPVRSFIGQVRRESACRAAYTH
jgi:hypothetical protein